MDVNFYLLLSALVFSFLMSKLFALGRQKIKKGENPTHFPDLAYSTVGIALLSLMKGCRCLFLRMCHRAAASTAFAVTD